MIGRMSLSKSKLILVKHGILNLLIKSYYYVLGCSVKASFILFCALSHIFTKATSDALCSWFIDNIEESGDVAH